MLQNKYMKYNWSFCLHCLCFVVSEQYIQTKFARAWWWSLVLEFKRWVWQQMPLFSEQVVGPLCTLKKCCLYNNNYNGKSYVLILLLLLLQWFVGCFEIEVTQAGFKHFCYSLLPMMDLNSWSSYLYLLSAGNSGMS